MSASTAGYGLKFPRQLTSKVLKFCSQLQLEPYAVVEAVSSHQFLLLLTLYDLTSMKSSGVFVCLWRYLNYSCRATQAFTGGNSDRSVSLKTSVNILQQSAKCIMYKISCIDCEEHPPLPEDRDNVETEACRVEEETRAETNKEYFPCHAFIT